MIQAWHYENGYLVGQTDGARVRLVEPLLRLDEIAPGVPRCPRDEGQGEWTWADGRYEQRVARFRQLGKKPPPGFGIPERTKPPWWRRWIAARRG